MIRAAVARGSRYEAHNLLGSIRRLFNWAIAQHAYGIANSPCDRIRAADIIGTKAIRTRVLDDGELRALWRATGVLGYPFGSFVRLLLLSGQRKMEVAQARWREIDFGAGIWTIPGERMKSGTPHFVPISTGMTEIIRALPATRVVTCFSPTGRVSTR